MTNMKPLGKPSIHAAVSGLTREELEEWFTNDDKIKEFVMAFPLFASMKTNHDALSLSVEALARSNLVLKEELATSQAAVAAKYEEFNAEQEEFHKQAEMFELLAKFYSPTVIKDTLKCAAQQSEEASESVAESFLKGECGVELFLKQFRSQRFLCHERRAKSERLEYQIDAQ